MMKLRCNGALPGILCLGIVLVILYIAQKYNKTFGRIQEDKVPESGTGLDTTNEKARSFTVIDADTTRESDTGPEFSEKTDKLYRQVESDVYYARQYILAQFRQISNRLTSEDNKQYLADEIESVKHHFSVTQSDLWKFRIESGLHAWQTRELEKLSDLVQHRIHVLQNPADCKLARKMLCNIPTLPKLRGLGSQFHHLTYCALAAYGTQRTLIINGMETDTSGFAMENFFLPPSENCTRTAETPMLLSRWKARVVHFPDIDRLQNPPSYMPRSVPKDIAERLMNVQGDPNTWWIGQFFKYTMKMNAAFQKYTEKLSLRLGFQRPIVGVQIRRTDKVNTEARAIELEQYMEAVEDYYYDLEVRGTNVTTRRIYLVTDEPRVLQEAREKYPNYEILFNKESMTSASMDKRSSVENKKFLMADIILLSRSDFLVCGMSSNICRLAYELMQTLRPDAPARVFSVDTPYYFHLESQQVVEARYPHSPRRREELELQKGDRVAEIPMYFRKTPNQHDGFLRGKNLRTGRIGFYPVYKTVNVLRIADTPSFDAIDNSEV